jgi:hypothetical protein
MFVSKMVVSGSGEVSLLLSLTQDIRQRYAVFLSRERNRGKMERSLGEGMELKR